VSAQPYPDDIDCVWLASDRDGHLGAFITAGVGPIPAAALDYVYIHVEDIEGRLCRLPLVSQAELLVSVKRPDDFIDLAERGVFVFDWTDIHRTARAALRVYEPVAVPTRPITASSLPSDLAALVEIVRLAHVAFTANEAIDVCAHLSCAEARAD
jgi:hypothetical protein